MMTKTIRYEADEFMPPEALRKAVEDPDLQRRVRDRAVIGDASFPADGRTNLNESSHIITELRMDGDDALVTLETLDTPAGRALEDALASGAEVRLGAAGITHPLTIATFHVTDLRRAP